MDEEDKKKIFEFAKNATEFAEEVRNLAMKKGLSIGEVYAALKGICSTIELENPLLKEAAEVAEDIHKHMSENKGDEL